MRRVISPFLTAAGCLALAACDVDVHDDPGHPVVVDRPVIVEKEKPVPVIEKETTIIERDREPSRVELDVDVKRR